MGRKRPTRQQQAARAQTRRQVQEAARTWRLDDLEPAQIAGLLHADVPFVHWAASEALMMRGAASVDALIAGLTHPDGKMRATCALLLDHVADDRCIEPLRRAMREDPWESVRRCAMHSLVCDGCKECPLSTDVVEALLESALTDRSKEVRRRAVFYLSQQRPDPRVAPALRRLLATEDDAVVRRRATDALERHRPVPRS